MKAKIITFMVGFLTMGVFYGLLLYFFGNEASAEQILNQALFFGFVWGLAEVFVFPWVRKRFGRQDKTS